MQRWQGAALALVLCSGCLEPLVDDEPGYSRYVLPQGSSVASAYDDLQINRKIDINDGVTAPAIPLKNGFAAGQPVQYWDVGAGKRTASVAYGLANCPDGAAPEPAREHPLIVDSIPGDSDYAGFRAIQWACIRPKYKGEVISSVEALNDAIDLGLISDPAAAMAPYWIAMPIVTRGVALTFPATTVNPQVAYYKGKTVEYHSFEQQLGTFPYTGMPLPVPNVYEIMKPGQMAPARVIFSRPYFDPENGGRHPEYSPNWLVVTVTLKAQADAAALDAALETLTQESDLVTVGMNNALTVKNPALIQSAVATMNRVNRPFLVTEVAAP